MNGIRAAIRRGLLGWAARRRPDVLCLQEVRAGADLVPDELLAANGPFAGYSFSYHPGDAAGRNGVAVLSRDAVHAVRLGFGLTERDKRPDGSDDFDAQGRYLEVDLPDLTVASLYLPKGAADGEKYESKMRFAAQLSEAVAASVARARSQGREYLLCGDFNIAPAEIDLKAWKTNRRSPGFLPAERAWIGALTTTGGLVDVVRALHPDGPGPYSWWSWRGKAFDNDSGWRIDHQLATPGLAGRAVVAGVDREPSYDARVSDHSAVVVDYRR
ncbi:exodeoxyribonuclease III [Nakamurella leprariae]|uniref:exodeoxyribonuclease III n=1 Tax=Nakamurella leprariae TaxID=2803911 RepID=UPI002E27B6D8|nr:exodeoxyribonuclease III [Nakamurella leprariae]